MASLGWIVLQQKRPLLQNPPKSGAFATKPPSPKTETGANLPSRHPPHSRAGGNPDPRRLFPEVSCWPLTGSSTKPPLMRLPWSPAQGNHTQKHLHADAAARYPYALLSTIDLCTLWAAHPSLYPVGGRRPPERPRACPERRPGSLRQACPRGGGGYLNWLSLPLASGARERGRARPLDGAPKSLPRAKAGEP